MVEWSGRYRYHTVDPTHSPLKAAPLVSYLSLFHFILVYYRLGWVGLGWVGLGWMCIDIGGMYSMYVDTASLYCFVIEIYFLRKIEEQ